MGAMLPKKCPIFESEIQQQGLTFMHFLLTTRLPMLAFALITFMVAGGVELYAQQAVSTKKQHLGIYFPTGYEAPSSGTATILNWNIENFVDSHDNPYINNDRENQPPALMVEKEALLIQAVRKSNPDIVVLQEFETARYLQSLALEHWADQGYQFFAEAPSLDWFQNVVIMSKFPLGIMRSYGNLFTNVAGSSTRDGLPETQALVNNRMWAIDVFPAENLHFILTAVHLKAGRNDRDIAMRKGQLEFLRGQFAQWVKQDRRVNILAMGDFNCTPESEEMMVMTQAKKSLRMYDLLPSGEEGYTHSSRDPGRRIDHVLSNKNMRSRILEVRVAKDLLPLNDLQKQSDHLPIITKMRID
jgi:endonuclease/exonuclease/phosphatase family metal-dependent hydrolase